MCGGGALATSLHCTEEVRLGQNSADPDGPSVPLDGSAAPLADSALPPAQSQDASVGAPSECEPVLCGAALQLCGDCIDNDGDGLVDAADPECLGPCDNDEASLVTGNRRGVNGSCRTDCYFDRNAGGGDDGCNWLYSCDPLSTSANDFAPSGLPMCEYDASASACTMSEGALSACNQGCLPLTPNGCDCFGCCELPAGSGIHVWLGAPEVADGSCNLDDPLGPNGCPRCTPVDACRNPCEACELCVGKPELPASCGAGGQPLPSCPSSQRPCAPAQGIQCGQLEYCITGCCAPLPQ